MKELYCYAGGIAAGALTSLALSVALLLCPELVTAICTTAVVFVSVCVSYAVANTLLARLDKAEEIEEN